MYSGPGVYRNIIPSPRIHTPQCQGGRPHPLVHALGQFSLPQGPYFHTSTYLIFKTLWLVECPTHQIYDTSHVWCLC